MTSEVVNPYLHVSEVKIFFMRAIHWFLKKTEGTTYLYSFFRRDDPQERDYVYLTVIYLVKRMLLEIERCYLMRRENLENDFLTPCSKFWKYVDRRDAGISLVYLKFINSAEC